MARRSEHRGDLTEPPTAAVLLSGGLGVFAVVAFVTALVFGVEVKNPSPGSRLGVTSSAGPAGVALLVPRCQSERVTAVELRTVDDTVWRIAARKGSIDERYIVGTEEAPFGFVVEEAFAPPLPDGPLTLVAFLEGEPFDSVDRVEFSADDVPDDGVFHLSEVVDRGAFEARAVAAADCQGRGGDLGLVNGLFVLAAGGVVVTYLMMVGRYLRSRRR